MENEADPQNLVTIKITHLIKFSESFSGIEIFLFLNARYVRLNYAQDQFVDILRKLQQKDLEEVHIKPEACKKILEGLKETMSSKVFYDPKTTDEDRMKNAEHSVAVIKNLISQLGVDKQTVDILKSVNKKTTDMLSESPSIFTFMKRFKKECSEEFLRSVLTGYLTSMVIDKFPWKSSPVKEKAALASVLCDITLQHDDFVAIKDCTNFSQLDFRIRNHPHEIAQMLSQKKDIIPSETITIIEQHHEKPDGSGFPAGIELGRFNQLSSIFIVCQQFTEQLFLVNFDYNKRHEILSNIQKVYNGRTFDKAMTALISIVS